MTQITASTGQGQDDAQANAPLAAAADEATEHLYVETDGRGCILQINLAWSQCLGWTAEDIAGMPLESLVHPRDVPPGGLTAARPLTVRLRRKAGGWVACAGLSRTKADGGLTAWFGDPTQAPSRPTSELDPPPASAPTFRVETTADIDADVPVQTNDPMLELQRIQRILAVTAGVWRWTIDPSERTIRVIVGDSSYEDSALIQSVDDLFSSLHPDDFDCVSNIIDEAMREGGSGSYDSRLRQSDGSWRWFRVAFAADRHPCGLYYVHGLSQEITELAEARDSALKNADRLSLALGAAGAAVAEIDFTVLRAWCSPGFVAIVGQELGFDESDPRAWPMCHEEDRERLEHAMATWEGDRHETVQFRVVHPSGAHRWVEVHGERELNDAGELAKITCLVLDIEARRQQELALAQVRLDAQANAERLQIAMDAARAGVFETDLANKTFWCSPEFEEIIGASMTFEEAAGIWPITHPDDVEVIQAKIENSRNGSGGECAEWRIRRPSGEYRWIEARSVVHHNAAGDIERLTGVVLDIDDRKRQELALIEAEQVAQSAAFAKTQFLANMSHEIRTPMNGVLGVLQLLAGEDMGDEAKRLLEEAERCGRMLSQLLNDVVDISKIESGRLDLELEAIDPKALLTGVADLLRAEATAKGLTLDVLCDGDDVWVQADPVRLRQSLFNLIGNALKFTTNGRVEARLFVTKYPARRRLLRFEIEDTGVGIPIAAQATLFDRFTQADGSTERRFGGSGLGLAITRRLADLMGGAVSFTSTEGIGSIFSLEFAAAEADAVVKADESETDDGPPLAGMTILVVEDNATNRMVATKLLESLGATVETAEDGLEGVEAVSQRRYDLVLMDIQMPRMDGVEATRQIRAMEGEVANIPIVALTANVMASQMQTYLEVGMNGVAAKPISLPVLLNEIAKAIDRPADVGDSEAASDSGGRS